MKCLVERSTPFEAERLHVVNRLAERFPDLDLTVVEIVDRTAMATADAKVKSFRALLVEHAARDELKRLTG